jgi:hypothetical protein
MNWLAWLGFWLLMAGLVFAFLRGSPGRRE